MNAAPDHERALFLLLRDGESPALAFEALLDHPDVQAYAFPAPWSWERAGVDLVAALPDFGSFERANLARGLDTLLRLHTPEALAELTQRAWREVEEPVRAFYLKRAALETMASILKLGPKSIDLSPPSEFREAQVILNPFEMQYRLRTQGEVVDPQAPAVEGSLVVYPFDAANAVARREGELGEGGAPVLEAFAYAEARARHRAVLEDVAHGRGWQVVDTLAGEGVDGTVRNFTE